MQANTALIFILYDLYDIYILYIYILSTMIEMSFVNSSPKCWKNINFVSKLFQDMKADKVNAIGSV